MPQIAAYEDMKAQKTQRQTPTGTAWRTNFISADEHNAATPVAFLVEGTEGRVIKPHFHENDQYQVIVHGNGVMGKHDLSVNAVHFTKGYTPYGPIIFGDQQMGFLTLRAHKDPGAQYLDEPEKLAKLKSIANRKPWQATELPKFTPVTDGAAVNAFTDIKGDAGLASFAMTVAANGRAMAPDPALTNGQYLIITRGSLIYQGKEYCALSVAFVTPEEGAFEVVAGADGVDALVLHFPRTWSTSTATTTTTTVQAKGAPGTRVWECMLCAFVYDEAKGMPDEGVAPGTPWEDVPEDWICPDCSTGKSEFQMRVVN